MLDIVVKDIVWSPCTSEYYMKFNCISSWSSPTRTEIVERRSREPCRWIKSHQTQTRKASTENMQTSLSISLFNDNKCRQCEVQLGELVCICRSPPTRASLLRLLRAIGETRKFSSRRSVNENFAFLVWILRSLETVRKIIKEEKLEETENSVVVTKSNIEIFPRRVVKELKKYS